MNQIDKNNIKKTKIIAKIINYHPDDLHFDYDDGSFEWFDSSELIIIEPSKLKKKKLFLHHNVPAKNGSIWFQKGAIVEIELKGDKNDIFISIFKDFIFIDEIIIKNRDST